MLNLFRSHSIDVESAYIITIKDNEKSERYSKACQESCEKLGMPYKVWDAFDGTNSTPGLIVAPPHMENDSIISMVKITDHYLTKAEVACCLSHLSLWIHCAVIDKPIVILEHDAIMLERLITLNSYNSIVYLGGSEWVNHNWPMQPLPPFSQDGPNWMFMCRAHAYAIDPIVAKNLISYALKHGINNSLDIMMRADLFNITHQGLYATETYPYVHGETTISNRSDTGRASYRNEKLEW
jgi:hypothetical protein